MSLRSHSAGAVSYQVFSCLVPGIRDKELSVSRPPGHRRYRRRKPCPGTCRTVPGSGPVLAPDWYSREPGSGIACRYALFSCNVFRKSVIFADLGQSERFLRRFLCSFRRFPAAKVPLKRISGGPGGRSSARIRIWPFSGFSDVKRSLRNPETGRVIRPGQIPVTGLSGVRKRTILKGFREEISDGARRWKHLAGIRPAFTKFSWKFSGFF